MRAHRPHLLIPFCAPVIAISVALTGCAELLEFLPEPETTPLSQSPDPAARAAGESASEVDKEREAQDKLKQAQAEKKIEPISEAIRLRPNDPVYRYHWIAFALAAEQDKDLIGSVSDDALLMLARNYPSLTYNELVSVASDMFLQAFLATMALHAPDTAEWRHLNGPYCKVLAGFEKDSPAFAGLYSKETCS